MKKTSTLLYAILRWILLSILAYEAIVSSSYIVFIESDKIRCFIFDYLLSNTMFWVSPFRFLFTAYGSFELFVKKRRCYGIIFLVCDIIVYITSFLLTAISV